VLPRRAELQGGRRWSRVADLRAAASRGRSSPVRRERRTRALPNVRRRAGAHRRDEEEGREVLARRRAALGLDHAAYAARRRETRRLPAEACVAAEGESDIGRVLPSPPKSSRSEEHTSELQSPYDLVFRLLLDKKKLVQ